MRNLFKKIFQLFRKKNTRTVYEVCNKTYGELGEYCVNELRYR